MSNLPEPELDLDLQFLPSWAKQSPDVNRYAKFAGGEDAGDSRRDGRRDFRPPRRDGGGSRDPRMNRGGPGGGGGDRGRGGPRPGDRGPDRRDSAPPPPREVAPLPQIDVVLMPDEKGVESITRQIKATGRAYPLFDIAQIILQKPERQQVKFESMRKPDGTPAQWIYVCGLDETPWATEEEVLAHVMSEHFATFYQEEKSPTDPPKGTYTFVAQCGISGVILGPPNHHDYQAQLRRLHTERFSRMPFEAFKARVKIVREEAVVKKWVDDLSWKSEYNCLNVPEPKKLASREEVEKHFREVHMPNVVKQVDSVRLTGPASRELKSAGLQRLIRHAWEEQKRFPIKLVTILSQQFASRGLHFFKVNKTITHVSVARPHFLDLEATPVSEGVRKIIQFINQHPRATRRHLIEGLTTAAPIPVPAPADPSAPPAEPQPTPEQSAMISDLHWLVHQGHVIEFANGIMEMAKRPAPKPAPRPSPAPKPAAVPAAGGAKPEGAPVDPAQAQPLAAEPESFEPVESEGEVTATESGEASQAPVGEASNGVAPVAAPEPSSAAAEFKLRRPAGSVEKFSTPEPSSPALEAAPVAASPAGA